MKNFLVVAKLKDGHAKEQDVKPFLEQLNVDVKTVREFTFHHSHVVLSDILLSDDGNEATILLLNHLIKIVIEDSDIESDNVKSFINLCEVLGIETVKYFLHRDHIEFFKGKEIVDKEYIEFYDLSKEQE